MASSFQVGDPSVTGLVTDITLDRASAVVDVLQRQKQFFNSNLLSDAVFLVKVDEKAAVRIPVHSFLLRMVSEPFNAMFSDNWKKEDPIEIVDFEPPVVYSLLRWIYCQELVFNEGSLTAVLMIANKYLVKSLISYAVGCFESFIWSVLAYAEMAQVTDLQEKCLLLITTKSNRFFSLKDFMNATVKSVTSIVSSHVLSISEIRLFERCLKWSEAECGKHGLEVSPANQRKVMDPFIRQIAFPAMSCEEFEGLPQKSGVLTPDEVSEIINFEAGSGLRSNIRFRSVARHQCRSRTASGYWHNCAKCLSRMCESCAEQLPSGHRHELHGNYSVSLSEDLCDGPGAMCT